MAGSRRERQTRLARLEDYVMTLQVQVLELQRHPFGGSVERLVAHDVHRRAGSAGACQELPGSGEWNGLADAAAVRLRLQPAPALLAFRQPPDCIADLPLRPGAVETSPARLRGQPEQQLVVARERVVEVDADHEPPRRAHPGSVLIGR